jgi:hypothetical protein
MCDLKKNLFRPHIFQGGNEKSLLGARSNRLVRKRASLVRAVFNQKTASLGMKSTLSCWGHIFLCSFSIFAAGQSSWSQSGGLPLLDGNGECIAWRSRSNLVWRDRAGKNIAEIKGTFLKHAVSANGNAIAVLEKIAGAKERKSESLLALRWFDRSGQSRGSHKLAAHNDDPLPQIAFDATGTHLFLALPATARATFLHQDGQALRETALFAETPYVNERPLFLAASAGVFAVLSQPSPATSAPEIICFSASGDEQWRRVLPVGIAGGLAISDDGNWMAAGRYSVNGSRVESTITIFNRNGELRANLNGLFRRAIFAKDNSRLLLMDRRQLRAVSLPQGELLWQVNLTQRSEMFVDIAATAPKKNFALAASSVFKENRFLFENARILAFDERGQQQGETPVTTALNSPWLRISDDGQRLALAAEGFLQSFTVSNLAK